MSQQKLEPWQWPEPHWRGIVERVRAGRTLRPRVWPNGARCAVALSFDSDHETNELREGGESIGNYLKVNTAIVKAFPELSTSFSDTT